MSPTGTFAIVVTRSGADLATYTFDKIVIPSGAKAQLFTETSHWYGFGPSRPYTGPLTALGMANSEDGKELSYLAQDSWNLPLNCYAKRVSLNPPYSVLSSDSVSSGLCTVFAGGAARRRSPIVRTR